MSGQSEIEDKYIKLAIALKTNQLKREELSSLTYQHVESSLKEHWRFRKPRGYPAAQRKRCGGLFVYAGRDHGLPYEPQRL